MSIKWEENQRCWWEQQYATRATAHSYRGSPHKPQGIRHYYAEKLFQQVRSGVAGKLWIDVGAGISLTIADLIHPLRYQYRYVATDISKNALRQSHRRIGQTPIISAASHLPFAESQ